MHQSNSKKGRNNSLDIARGIAIIGVLYGHALAWQGIPDTLLTQWFWSFHMALFALISGYFYKEKNFKELFISSFKSLLVPCFLVSFTLFFTHHVFFLGGGQLSCHELLIYTFRTFTLRIDPPGFWFVIALFNCRMILAIVSKFSFKYKYILLACFSMFVFFFPKHIGLFQTSRTFGLMVFVIIGIYAKKYNLLDRPISRFGATILALVLLSAGLFFIDIWRYNMPLYVLNFISASVISYALIYYSKQFDQINISLFSPIKQLLAFCGQHSLMVLSFQAILGIKYIQFLNNYTHIENEYILMVLFLVSCIVLTYVLNGIKVPCVRFFNKIK